MCVCVGKRAHGEAERESDSEQRPLPLIKLRSNYAKRLQIRSWQFGVMFRMKRHSMVLRRKGKERRRGREAAGAQQEWRWGEIPCRPLTQPGHPSLDLSFERSVRAKLDTSRRIHTFQSQPPFGHDPQNNWQEEGFSSFFFLFSSLVSVGVSPFVVHAIVEVCCDIILFTKLTRVVIRADRTIDPFQ